MAQFWVTLTLTMYRDSLNGYLCVQPNLSINQKAMESTIQAHMTDTTDHANIEIIEDRL